MASRARFFSDVDINAVQFRKLTKHSHRIGDGVVILQRLDQGPNRLSTSGSACRSCQWRIAISVF